MDERLRRFLGKPKKYEIDGEEFELTPLTGKDLDLLTNIGEDAESMKKLMLKALQQINEDATQKDIDELPIAFLNKLAEAFIDVNGLSK